jgi:hypothetical protein
MANQTPGALAGVRLDHSSPVPLYYQAAQALEQLEEEFAEKFGGASLRSAEAARAK